MAIIRDNPEDWTAQLTGEELIMYLVLHFKMEPEDAEQQVKDKKDGELYVRLPLHVNTLQQLLLHLVLQDKELFNIEELSDEFVDELTKLVYDTNGGTNDRHDSDSTVH